MVRGLAHLHAYALFANGSACSCRLFGTGSEDGDVNLIDIPS